METNEGGPSPGLQKKIQNRLFWLAGDGGTGMTIISAQLIKILGKEKVLDTTFTNTISLHSTTSLTFSLRSAKCILATARSTKTAWKKSLKRQSWTSKQGKLSIIWTEYSRFYFCSPYVIWDIQASTNAG